MLDHLTSGKKENYLRTVKFQPGDDKLTRETFCHLADRFFLLRQRPQLYNLAEMYLIFEYYSRTHLAQEDQDAFSREEREFKSKYGFVLKCIEKSFFDEVPYMDLASFECLIKMFRYAEQVTESFEAGEGAIFDPDTSDAERNTVHNAVVCEVAAIAGIGIYDSLSLTESVASGFIYLLNHLDDPKIVSTLMQYGDA